MGSQASGKKKNLEYEHRYRVPDMAPVLERARALGGDPPRRFLLTNASFRPRSSSKKFTPVVRVRVSTDVATGAQDTTLTVKRKTDGQVFEEEYEVSVSDSHTTVKMMELLGLRHVYTMQKFRTVVSIPGLGELDIDEPPGLPPYLEVESPSMAQLKRLTRALGGSIGEPEQFSVLDLYTDRYGVRDTKKIVGDLTFENPSTLPRLVTRGKGAFERTLRAQQREARSAEKLAASKGPRGPGPAFL